MMILINSCEGRLKEIIVLRVEGNGESDDNRGAECTRMKREDQKLNEHNALKHLPKRNGHKS
jgi:hypothetical protein